MYSCGRKKVAIPHAGWCGPPHSKDNSEMNTMH